MEHLPLPHRPFPQTPLVWGAPPGVGDEPSIIAPAPLTPPTPGAISSLSAALTAATFGINYLGGAITTAFPNAVRVATLTFSSPVGIVSVALSSSMSNVTADGICGVFICKDVGAIVNMTMSTIEFASHLVVANAAHSQRSGVTFADDVAPKFGSNERMAMYVSSAGTGAASNFIVALATVRYFALT